jgi:hypothetical protein
VPDNDLSYGQNSFEISKKRPSHCLISAQRTKRSKKGDSLVSSKIASKLALVLALTVLASSSDKMHAQSPTTPPTVVTGSDPQPSQPQGSAMGILLPILIATITR